jgi:hypothetical protein
MTAMTAMTTTTTEMPFRYGGETFQTYLEAKWAAFFDLVKWGYKYRPLDFPGWTPTFSIYGTRPVLVAVEPNITEEARQRILSVYVGAPGYKRPIELFEMLLLSDGLIKDDEYDDHLILGRLWESNGTPVGNDTDAGPLDQYAVLGVWTGSDQDGPNKNPTNQVGFGGDLGAYYDRITGHDDSGAIGGRGPIPDFHALWNEAHNRVREEFWKDMDRRAREEIEKYQRLYGTSAAVQLTRDYMEKLNELADKLERGEQPT